MALHSHTVSSVNCYLNARAKDYFVCIIFIWYAAWLSPNFITPKVANADHTSRGGRNYETEMSPLSFMLLNHLLNHIIYYHFRDKSTINLIVSLWWNLVRVKTREKSATKSDFVANFSQSRRNGIWALLGLRTLLQKATLQSYNKSVSRPIVDKITNYCCGCVNIAQRTMYRHHLLSTNFHSTKTEMTQTSSFDQPSDRYS